MIRRSRTCVDQAGKPVAPGDPWFAKAKEWTGRAVREGRNHAPRGSIYGSDVVRAALEELFHRKCAYCESLVEDFDVDHYRPTGAVAESPGHSGYYWLAYDWTNLLPACRSCNQTRRDPPTWSDPESGPGAGKLHQFPLEEESERAQGPSDPLDREKPLLLNPCEDDPQDFFSYDVFSGKLVARRGNRRAETTIRVLNLNRKRLCDRRKAAVASLLSQSAGGELTPTDASAYCGVCRVLLQDPDSLPASES